MYTRNQSNPVSIKLTHMKKLKHKAFSSSSTSSLASTNTFRGIIPSFTPEKAQVFKDIYRIMYKNVCCVGPSAKIIHNTSEKGKNLKYTHTHQKKTWISIFHISHPLTSDSTRTSEQKHNQNRK